MSIQCTVCGGFSAPGTDLCTEHTPVRLRSTPTPDPINPSHYQGAYVMRIIEDFNLDFLDGQVIKYLLRSGNKPSTTPLEDHLKAKWYLDRKIANLEKPKT